MPCGGVLGDFAGRTRDDDLAFADDVGPVRDLERVAHVVVGNEYADAFPGEAGYGRLQVGHRNWVDARERLIQQEDLRFRDQCPGNLGAAAFSA